MDIASKLHSYEYFRIMISPNNVCVLLYHFTKKKKKTHYHLAIRFVFIFFPARPTLNGSVVSAAASHEFLSDPDQVSPETTAHAHISLYTAHTTHSARCMTFYKYTLHAWTVRDRRPNYSGHIYIYYNYCGPSNLTPPSCSHLYKYRVRP